jgi:hypothetical protein
MVAMRLAKHHSSTLMSVAPVSSPGSRVFENPGFYDLALVPQLSYSVVGGFLSCNTSEGATTFYGCADTSGEQFPLIVYFFPPDAVVGDNCSPLKLK